MRKAAQGVHSEPQQDSREMTKGAEEHATLLA